MGGGRVGGKEEQDNSKKTFLRVYFAPGRGEGSTCKSGWEKHQAVGRRRGGGGEKRM